MTNDFGTRREGEAMTKKEAREMMRQRRKEMSSRERRERNRRIRENLLALEEVERAGTMYSFVSYGTEADTLSLLSTFLQQGRLVAVPKVSGEDMAFYQIAHLEELEPGFQGIPEPPETHLVRGEGGVMLLPGLAFDRHRNRVGYGGGYYDRYLAEEAGAGLVTVAIAYDFQVVERLVVDDYDWRPDILVTDRRVIR